MQKSDKAARPFEPSTNSTAENEKGGGDVISKDADEEEESDEK